MDALLADGAERRRLVVGVGGGVASDLFGFACATYMRGVRYAHVATSLVAMVDAAIGGKTGVDLRGGKNLAGVFRDPVAVFCDLEALADASAPRAARGARRDRQGRRSSKAAISSSCSKSSRRIRSARWPWADVVIEQAVKVKTMIVADDRHEAGMRELLNLGHTFAHAIERASRLSHHARRGGRARLARGGAARAAHGAFQRSGASARPRRS